MNSRHSLGPTPGYSSLRPPQNRGRRSGGLPSVAGLGDLPLPTLIAAGGGLFLLILLFVLGKTANTEPAVAELDDSGLQTSIQASLTRVGYGDIVVAVDGRTATLDGQLATRADVVAATAVANSIADVAYVDSRLTFTGEPDLGSIAGNTGTSTVSTGSASNRDLLFQSRLSGIAARNSIQFETGSPELKESSLGTISQIADLLLENPGRKIEIGGHTDSDGEVEANRLLSEARAQAVLTEMVNAGVETERLTAIGYGDELPVASNETGEGKSLNRRIEFLVIIG